MVPGVVVPALALAGMGLMLLARPFASQRTTLTSLPWQVYRIAVDPRLRRNHALEHATLHVLEQRYGRPTVNGAAVSAGFVLRGWVNPVQIAAAASEGLARLQAGERHLAQHPRCGTSIGTAEFLTWLVLALLLVLTGRLDLISLATVLALTLVLAPWAGRLVQKYLTTSADVGHLSIQSLQFRPMPLRRAPDVPPPEGAMWGEVGVTVRHGAPR